jgi:hypothetical protein
MGGVGSGNRYQTRAVTVEESLTVAIRDIYSRRCSSLTGKLRWTWGCGSESSIGYFFTWGEVPSVTLHYRLGDGDDIRLPIRLQTTATQFGGQRFWLTCPIINDGVACNCRVAKLHLPGGQKYFGCRECHGLSYRSSQEAHFLERLISRSLNRYPGK